MPTPRTEYALLGLLALLWGSSYLFIRVAVETIPPVTLVALRVSIASVLLLAIARAQGHRLPRDPGTWGHLAVQSFLNSYGAWTLLAWGQQYVESGLAGVLNSTAPVFVVLISALWLRRASKARAVAGACLGLAGVVLIMGPEVLAGLGRNVAAQGAVLAGSMLYAFAALNGGRFAHLPPVITAAGTMLVAAVVLIPASLVLEQPWTLSPSAKSLAAASALGLLCTGLAMFLYFRLLRTLGPLGAASQAYLRAGVAVVLGMVILGETLDAFTALGIATALAGVILINWPGARAQAKRVAQAGSMRPPRRSDG
ncbi:MAG: EamA family transporter [Pseudomonadota bacterium]